MSREEAELDREVVRRFGFYPFIQRAWEYVPLNKGLPFVDNWHIEEKAIHCQAIIHCNCDPKNLPDNGWMLNKEQTAWIPHDRFKCKRGRIKDLVINEPPGCSKSVVVSIMWPAWAWTVRPELRWLFASFDAPEYVVAVGRASATS